MKKCKYNKYDEIIEPSVHDAEVIAVSLENEDQINITILNDNKDVIYFYLLGVEKFKCNNFLEGNIILDITVYNSQMVPQELLAQILNSDEISFYEKKLLNNELVFFSLQPSYGCEILAICRTIKYKTKVID